ncbi:MAG: PDZ domain-containing protein [Polyangiaceae bacterium]|nr:PDZ domain-containing protein [Polyangiaceae bacterium]
MIGVAATRSLLLASLAAACSPPPGTIGAVLGQATDGTVRVREAPEGLAAAEAGLEPGDQILLVDGMDVRAFDPEELHDLLSGDVGDPVRVTVLRGGEVRRLTLERTPIPKQKHRRKLRK